MSCAKEIGKVEKIDTHILIVRKYEIVSIANKHLESDNTTRIQRFNHLLRSKFLYYMISLLDILFDATLSNDTIIFDSIFLISQIII